MGQGRFEYDLRETLLKDDSELERAIVPASEKLVLPTRATMCQHAIAGVYDRIGGLIQAITRKTQIDPAAVLAVWFVESGGIPFVKRRAVIKLEVHELFEAWGRRDRQKFDSHFRFGGHNQQPGHPWENQDYRTEESGTFSSVRHNQSSEYAALTLAQVMATDEIAFSCTSIGGCQILMAAHRMIGYETAAEMHEAFQESERFHLLGFTDFCSEKLAPKCGDLLRYLDARDWNSFAKYYNGEQATTYAARLKSAYEVSKGLLNVPRAA